MLFRSNMISRWMDDSVLSAVQKLLPIAEDCGLTMGQLSLAWVLQNENVSSAIVGATKPRQLKENVKAAGVKLDSAILNAIDQAIGAVAEKDPSKSVSPKPRA